MNVGDQGFGVVAWVLIVFGALVVLGISWLIYLSVVLAWGDSKTNGLGYYGLDPAERERFKRTLRLHALLLFPVLRFLGMTSKATFEGISFRHAGIAGPKGTCSEETFARAIAYEPRPEDVFVVTPMKCGTTWMQHVVYQVLHRGAGDLVGAGTALYAVCPWLASSKGVSVQDAPLLGRERPSRLIKTHLPAQLCPFDRAARFVYVERDAVSCFASCVDFVATNLGAMAPDLAATERWFTSDAMWWGPWPAHVRGWRERAAAESNVLVVRFEDMKADLASVVRQVAAFLGVAPLNETELAGVLEKCSFGYMQRHGTTFEMHPPHLMQTDAQLFVRGSADRHKDVPEDVRARIRTWCDAYPSE